MSSHYGLEIRNSKNEVMYSTEAVTWMFLDMFYVKANGLVRKKYYNMEGFHKVSAQSQPVTITNKSYAVYAPQVSYAFKKDLEGRTYVEVTVQPQFSQQASYDPYTGEPIGVESLKLLTSGGALITVLVQ